MFQPYRIMSFVFVVLSMMMYGVSYAHESMSQTDTVSSSEEPFRLSIYERPYSLDENIIDKKMLGRNTAALFGTGIGTMGLLYVMPSSFTNWEDDGKSPTKKMVGECFTSPCLG